MTLKRHDHVDAESAPRKYSQWSDAWAHTIKSVGRPCVLKSRAVSVYLAITALSL